MEVIDLIWVGLLVMGAGVVGFKATPRLLARRHPRWTVEMISTPKQTSVFLVCPGQHPEFIGGANPEEDNYWEQLQAAEDEAHDRAAKLNVSKKK